MQSFRLDEMKMEDNMTGLETLQGKKVIVFGERDDISGKTVANCLLAGGAEVIYESTACFV